MPPTAQDLNVRPTNRVVLTKHSEKFGKQKNEEEKKKKKRISFKKRASHDTPTTRLDERKPILVLVDRRVNDKTTILFILLNIKRTKIIMRTVVLLAVTRDPGKVKNPEF